MTLIKGIRFEDSPSIDAFARARVSNPVTLFDSKQLHDAAPLFWDDVQSSGSGTSSSHSTDTAATTISVSATTAGKRTRQTFQRFNYQPGKSQLILMTGVLATGKAGITAGFGAYDDDNGIFLQRDATTINLVRRTSTSGSPVDNDVAQASWNLDTMDGNGPSGITLDFDKAQILIIDFEWLGVGRVRVGFVVDGIPVYCHEFLNANNLTTVYMSTPNLPLRYEIENDGTGQASSLVHICASVMSEGGVQENGVLRYASTAGTHVDMLTENTLYALIGIRLKSTHLDAAIDIVSVAMQIHTATDKCEWQLLLNPTVAGTFTFADQTNSAVQIATGTSTSSVTVGTALAGGYIESGGAGSGAAGSKEAGLANAIRLGATYSNVADRIVLAARPIAGSSAVDMEAGLTWRELT